MFFILLIFFNVKKIYLFLSSFKWEIGVLVVHVERLHEVGSM